MPNLVTAAFSSLSNSTPHAGLVRGAFFATLNQCTLVINPKLASKSYRLRYL